MDEWKRETRAGNALFEQGDYTKAEQHYLSACHFADIFLMPSADPDGGVAALVVSYQNLAELYRAQGRHPQAMRALQAAHARLSHALSAPGLCHAHQQALLRGSGQVRMEIMNTVQWLGVTKRRTQPTKPAEHSTTRVYH
ncbi:MULTISPECIES: tetratricopeptide repeat protein [unclassified Cobetia]|uniref:tetratricopeptide repeat protein n=1 Tax=unclassified Cobetia TaxID=2609414 RepID=UPI002096A638|nr:MULTISPECIES: tetratricopeptide repeat protein [unclassified Cobetia]MCO7233726.1 tetratricopeptide repeat protein [Cobetia sp. Dlab-2-AX]MCO7237101.1 tetratricopeptide repeat protein [Cobetia sp. Dlab-2-U]